MELNKNMWKHNQKQQTRTKRQNKRKKQLSNLVDDHAANDASKNIFENISETCKTCKTHRM